MPSFRVDYEENIPHLLRQFKHDMTLAVSHPAMAASGSNLGDYATHYVPAVLNGQVKDTTGTVVEGAMVSTITGHFTVTDADGNYTLTIDSPGIYSVKAYKDSVIDVALDKEVFLGQTTTLNFRQVKKGDVNGDGFVDLVDAVLVLQLLVGIEIDPLFDIYKQADVSGDQEIGIEELIYILQYVSELRLIP